MWLLLLALSADATVPLPSYRDQVVRRTWVEVNDLVEARLYDEAIAKAEAFQRHVVEDATLAYLVGLAWRLQDDAHRAEVHYRRALALDPTLVEAWSDLGELQLVQGRFDESRQSFQQVADLVTEGPHAWVGPRRLAEVAAHQQDPQAFEGHVREAVRRGFSFRMIEGLPNWRKYYADPIMRSSIENMITVYGSPRTLDTLQDAEGR